MSKCNGYCSSDSDEESMIEEDLVDSLPNSVINLLIKEDLVDSLPNSAVNLLYYVESHAIYHLQPHIYYIDDTHLYTKRENGYHPFILEPNKYMRIPLILNSDDVYSSDVDAICLYCHFIEPQTDYRVVCAKVELLLTDERIRDVECINALRRNVYSQSQDGSIEYFASDDNSDEEPDDEELDKLLIS